MKQRIASILLALLLVAALCITALAEEEGQEPGGPIVTTETDESGNTVTIVDFGNGTTAQELPGFGEEDELIFPTADAPGTESGAEPTEIPEEPGEPEENTPESDLVSPAPENTRESGADSKENKATPVVLVIAVLAACGVLALVLIGKNRKSAGK